MHERRRQTSVHCTLAQAERSGSPKIAVIRFSVLLCIWEGPVSNAGPETNSPDTIFLLVEL